MVMLMVPNSKGVDPTTTVGLVVVDGMVVVRVSM
jgi:hypothetical protein